MKKTLSDLKEAALLNIEADRQKATDIINNISAEIAAQKGTYSFHAQSFAKLIETMQRSNEQLVKIISLGKEDDNPSKNNLNEKDFDRLYDELSNEDMASKKRMNKKDANSSNQS